MGIAGFINLLKSCLRHITFNINNHTPDAGHFIDDVRTGNTDEMSMFMVDCGEYTVGDNLTALLIVWLWHPASAHLVPPGQIPIKFFKQVGRVPNHILGHFNAMVVFANNYFKPHCKCNLLTVSSRLHSHGERAFSDSFGGNLGNHGTQVGYCLLHLGIFFQAHA